MAAYADGLQASGTRIGRAQAEDIRGHLARLRQGQPGHE
jgi:hypothetical protein